jgi:hypothetical protein
MHILVIKQLQQMTAYRKFRKKKTANGFRNRKRLFPVLPIVKKKKKKKIMPTDPGFFLTCDDKHTYFIFWPYSDLNCGK